MVSLQLLVGSEISTRKEHLWEGGVLWEMVGTGIAYWRRLSEQHYVISTKCDSGHCESKEEKGRFLTAVRCLQWAGGDKPHAQRRTQAYSKKTYKWTSLMRSTHPHMGRETPWTVGFICFSWLRFLKLGLWAAEAATPASETSLESTRLPLSCSAQSKPAPNPALYPFC